MNYKIKENIMKKILCTILVLTCVFALFGCFGSDSESDDKFTYTLRNDGTYEIAAKSTTSVKGDLVIPEEYKGIKITAIAEYGFRDCDQITSVTMGNNITTVETAAFFRCDSLMSVNLPGSLEWLSTSGIVGQCPMIMEINYDGTVAQFKDLVNNCLDTWVNTSVDVYCTDGKTHVWDKND